MSGFIINPYAHGGAGGGSFSVDAADFDGTNDYQRRASTMTGATDSKTAIFSAWVYGDTDIAAGFGRILYCTGPSDTLVFHITSSEGIAAFCSNEISLSSNNSVFTYNAWHHILMSWDVATSTTHLYMDGADVKSLGSTNNANIVYSTMDSWTVGADNGTTGKWNGGIAEVYFAPNQYLDFSVQANREKFILAGKPVDLGDDGSTPTGVAPLIYCHLDNGESAANFATNRAGAGDFTVTGALTTYASSPAD